MRGASSVQDSYLSSSSKTFINNKSIQEEVQDIFDEIDHPNIAYVGDYIDPIDKTKKFVYLEEKYKLPIPEHGSTQIIKDVLEGIVEIQSHLLIYKPCQIFKEHIIFKESRWGICNIICYRDRNEDPQKHPSRYWPIDYDELHDEDSELVWSIGRMWFELITGKILPPIKELNQNKIDSIIDQSKLKDLRIVTLLKQILVIDPQNRFTFKDIIDHKLFEFPEISKINMHSMMPSKKLQETKLFRLGTDESLLNPFEQELFKRDFKESIVVADLLEGVKKWITKNYEIKGHLQQIEFSCYLIDLKSYLILRGLEKEREKKQYDLILLADKSDYTKFLYRKVELQSKVDRKRKMRKFDKFRASNSDCLCHLDEISEDSVHHNFKSYLTSYAESLKEKKLKNHPTPELYARLLQLIMVRCVKYIFKSCRQYVFSEFIQKDEIFDLEKVLQEIEQCKDLGKLRNLQQKILDLYFHQEKTNGNS